MKKRFSIYFAVICLLAVMISGCGDASKNNEGEPGTASKDNNTTVETADEISVKETDTDEASAIVGEQVKNEPDETGTNEDVTDKTQSGQEQPAGPEGPEGSESSEESKIPENMIDETDTDTNDLTKSERPTVVWLGDSLTQGSLEHKDDNLANAPYERLKKTSGLNVEGYGLYGYKTHDIFWVYSDEDHFNQQVDPNKIYVFWVGSNDWVDDGVPNSNTAPVINEIDAFLQKGGGITKYIVMGTTSRWNLGDLYIPINNDLAAHYGVHYMDVIDIINRFGYSPDNTHLSQASYDAIADTVYDKMKALGYI